MTVVSYGEHPGIGGEGTGGGGRLMVSVWTPETKLNFFFTQSGLDIKLTFFPRSDKAKARNYTHTRAGSLLTHPHSLNQEVVFPLEGPAV